MASRLTVCAIVAGLLLSFVSADVFKSTSFTKNFSHQTQNAIDQTISSADRLSDILAAVNSSTCLSNTAFDVSKRTASDRLALEYLRIGVFRHVREGFAPDCYHPAEYDAFWSALVAHDNVRRIGGIGVGYTRSQIASLRLDAPGLEALEFANEWDEAQTPTDGSLKLGEDAKSGSTRMALAGRYSAWYWTVPGQSYLVGDGADGEAVTLSSELPDSLTVARISKPFVRTHPAGSTVKRVGDFVSDAELWYSTYVPVLHALQPGLEILAPSMAHPVDDAKFAHTRVGKYVDALDSHPYPIGGYNPEGPDGDGIRGWILGDQGPCTQSNTSFSFVFNVTCEGALQTNTEPGHFKTWITEFSYETVPNRATFSSTWPTAIPDDVGVDYLDGMELFASKHNVAHVFWFQLQDGTSGRASPFCTYGLIRNEICSSSYDPKPQAKPEFLALMALSQYFNDPQCPFPKCGAAQRRFVARWAPDALPLNTVNAKFADGRIALIFWLGVRSYNGTSSAPCAAETGCYIPIRPRSERVSSPTIAHARNVYLSGIDDNPNDPLPANEIVTPQDGLGTVAVQKCPAGPTSIPEFGCVLPYVKLAKDGDSVTVSATRRLQWILTDNAK